MAFIKFFCGFFLIRSFLLLRWLIKDCDFVLDVLDCLVDFCWPRWGKQINLLELVDRFDIMGEVLFLFFLLLCWLLMLWLLLLIGLALL
jgi:hypothetical protein